MAALTLSFASSTDFEGSPTMVKDGRLLVYTSTSTVIGIDSKPTVAPERTLANIYPVYYEECVGSIQFI